MQFQSFLIIAPEPADHKQAVLRYVPFEHGERNPDVLWVEQEGAIGIEAVRELIVSLSKKPYQEPYKVIAVLHAQNLTPEAQQALLKSLEEPPENTRIILATTNEYALLPTIRSRCERFWEPMVKNQDSIAKIQYLTTLTEAFHMAEKYKDRAEAVGFCQTLLFQQHAELENQPNQENCAALSHTVRAIERLKKNVNVRLAMESLFFALAKPEDFV